MALELWMQGGGHWFVETDFGDVIVGQAEQSTDGTWSIEVNGGDWFHHIPDLEAAKRVFVDNYYRPQATAQLGPGSSSDGPSSREGFTVVKLRTTRSPFRRP